MRAKTALVLALGLLCGVTLACGLSWSQPTGTPPVVQLMPDLPGYRVIEGKTIAGYIATLAEGGALLSGNPQMVFLIERVDEVIACYQDLGAVNVRVFNDESFPLSSGAIAIVDQNRLTDPETLLRCTAGRLMPAAADPTMKPCAHNYTLDKEGSELHVVYIGTTQQICQTFCANLEGCTGH